MASIRISEWNRTIVDADEISIFLAPFGMTYRRWPLEERVSPDAAPEDILAAYRPEIDELKRAGGYVTADVINVTAETPNLDALLNKFNKEHRHSEDEVRFIVKGSGIFHIHPENHPVFAIQVGAGDLITVPTGTRHWFDLCADRTIRAIRLFQDMTGWTPEYVEQGVHAEYSPLCWGPRYLKSETAFTPTVRV